MQYKELDDKTQPYPDFGEILSTSIISSDTVATEKRKPRLAGRGLKVAEGNPTTREESVPPSLAYSAINDNSHGLLGAEMAMTYQPTGFVKIPRSLFTHPAWEKATHKYRYIFYEFLIRAAWAPTCFYWNGNRVDLQIGQLYFSRKSLSKELNGGGEKEGGISENDIRGCIKYFSKSKFLTSALTRGLTNGPTIITILYSSFCEEEKSLPNPSSHQRSNQHLTSASPTKEEKKEDKEEEKKKEKKKRSERRSAPVDDADASRLCLKFLEMLEKTLPHLKPPANLESWNREFHLMLKKDERSIADIELLFEKMPGHWYSKNIQCAAKFREKFPTLMGHHTESKEVNTTTQNRAWFLECKRDNPKQLRSWTASGDWVLNSYNSKEISLKMGHTEFKKAFLAAVGGQEIG